jgi:hypothetical protein
MFSSKSFTWCKAHAQSVGWIKNMKNDERKRNLIRHDEKQKHSFNEIQIFLSK